MKRYSFLEELLEKRDLEDHCCSIESPYISKTFAVTSKQHVKSPLPQPVVYTKVPDYMNVTFRGHRTNKSEKSVAVYEGSYIDLGLYRDMDHLLKSKLSPKRVSKLRAYKRNLEYTFPITYVFHFGEITDGTYCLLMDSLKQMITERFEEKKMEHTALPDWEIFKQRGKKLIEDKNAVLIAIYDNDRPIHISFNYIWEKLVFGYVRGFDQDYSKFYLGYIDIMVQLEWCFKNGFQIYDLMRGNLSYKLLWADKTYLYRTHILFAPGAIHKNLVPLVHWIANVVVYDVYYTLIGLLKNFYHRMPFLPKKKREASPKYHFEKASEDEKSKIEGKQMNEVTMDSLPFKIIRRAALHFLYISKEKYSDLQIFHNTDDPDIYFFKSIKNILKVRFDRSMIN